MDLEEYLAFIDTRAPDQHHHKETVNGFSLDVHPGVWNPAKGKSSKMMLKVLETYPLVDKALDIGTGSGVLALKLKYRGVPDVTATEYMDKAYENARLNFQGTGIKLIKSDLFENIDGKYDLIVFNCPASHPKRTDISRSMYPLWSPDLDIRMKFIEALPEHLNENGTALLMYSRFPDFDPIPEDKINMKFNYLIRDTSSLSESGIIELRL
jgi:16S rRNA G1207 methylase RsmC